jgi:hypothetical protein
MILKLKSSRLSYILVLIWPLSSNSRYKSKNVPLSVLSSDGDPFLHLVCLIWGTLKICYDKELEVKETTDTASSASFLDLYLEFDDSGQISTKIYDKRDDFNFKIINFPIMCSNIPASPAYGVYAVSVVSLTSSSLS